MAASSAAKPQVRGASCTITTRPAVRHAHHEREFHLPARPPAVATDMRDQLVEAGIGERVILHLAHRPPARHAEADGTAENPRLRERCVETTVGPEPFAQSGGGA